MPKCGVFSGPYFPVFSLNMGKYRLEKTPYLDTFEAVRYRMYQVKLVPKSTENYDQKPYNYVKTT